MGTSISLKAITTILLSCGISVHISGQNINPDMLPRTSKTEAKTDGKILKMVSEYTGPLIDVNHADVVASKNGAGFETGQVVKVNNIYHMFVNEMFERPHRDLRIAYWTSPDAVKWERKNTVVESIPGRTPVNPRSEVWVTGVVFNEEENAWNIFYVAYRGGDESKGEIAGNDYEGRIWRAKSVKTGQEGISGPYADMGIVMQPDENSQLWEGQQAVACFNPYKVGDIWFTMYDGHNHVPIGPLPTGMAYSKNLKGLWIRMPVGFNPIQVADVFMENEIVTRLKDGRYIMIFDSFGDQEIGYSISQDGIQWEKETRVKIQSGKNLWAAAGNHSARTPLCAIEEDNGTFTVIYTALKSQGEKKFYAIGKCTLAWTDKK